MRVNRIRFVVLAVILAVSCAASSMVLGPAPHAEASTGPTISVDAATYSNALVVVPISTSGSGFTPYIGVYAHLRWPAANFRFIAMSAVGGIFDPTAGMGTCGAPLLDADGAGVALQCASQTGTTTSATGVVFLVSLAPLQTGCSLLHLESVGAPDNAGALGTYTGSGGFPGNQTNVLIDNTATETGSTCDASTPTPGTPIGAPTSSPTVTAVTGTATPTPINDRIGATIAVGTPTILPGRVDVPVLLTGSGFNGYVAWQVRIAFDPNILQFESESAAGGVIDPNENFCGYATFGGVTGFCSLSGNNGEFPPSALSTGLMATFSFRPLAFGCSQLHLGTMGPPDNLTSDGTYTVAPDITAQDNVLVDGTVCYAPTPTPTATPTFTVTPTATATPTATPTNIGAAHAVGGITNLEVQPARLDAAPAGQTGGNDTRTALAVSLALLVAIIGAGGLWYARSRWSG